MLLFAGRLAVHVAGHAGAQQARLQGGAFDGFQGTVGIVESGRQRGIADHAAQMHGFVVADHERARRQLFTQGRGDAFQAVLIGGAGGPPRPGAGRPAPSGVRRRHTHSARAGPARWRLRRTTRHPGRGGQARR
ncbi:hypothetical protein G6F61_014418 [Rhizopus arrhizus]|nr:hypothetical protein G6F61_014418 [Rhizopus arrhizus]